MEITTFLYFLFVLFSYILAATVATAVPALIVLFFYRRKMNQYYDTTGLNPYTVPVRLRQLIPLAKKWSIENQEDRKKAFQEATSEDRFELSKKLTGKLELIYQWLAGFNNRSFTPEAKAFYLLSKVIAENNLFIENFNTHTELSKPEVNNFEPEVIPHTRWFIHESIRVVKIPGIVRALLGIVLFIVYFIIWGKLWAFFFPVWQR